MASLDAPMRAVARTIVNKFGATAQYIRRSAGAYDSTSGKRNKAEWVVPIKGVFDEYKKNEINDQIQVGDRKFLVAAADINFEPKQGDQIKIQNRLYRVEDTDAAMSGDQSALWSFQLRGTSA